MRQALSLDKPALKKTTPAIFRDDSDFLMKRFKTLLLGRTRLDRLVLLALGALASGFLHNAASRTSGWSFLYCFLALVPFLLALSRIVRLGEALLGAVFFCAAYVTLVFSWFPFAVASYAKISETTVWFFLLLFSPVLVPQILVFVLVRQFVGQDGKPNATFRAALAGAAAYAGLEIVLPKLFMDTLGMGLYPSIELRQAADIAGPHGLTFLLVLVNEGIAWSFLGFVSAREPGWKNHPALPLAIAFVMVTGCYGYGRVRLHSLEVEQGAPALTVGIVQANITRYDKLRAEKGAFETVRLILDEHFALSDDLRKRGAPDLIVWPETMYPTTFGAPKSEDGAALDEEIRNYAKKNHVPLIFGSYEREGNDEYNAVFFLTPQASGEVTQASYRKRMLFPLTEWVPELIDSSFLRESWPWTGHWKRGRGGDVVRLEMAQGKTIGIVPLVCYDVLFPDLSREAAEKGADLIVTLSNDAWFPDGRAPRLHLISAAFRSIETRLPQVRATISGISAIISPSGEIVKRTRFDEKDTILGSVSNKGHSRSPMMLVGHWRAPFFLAVVAFSLGFAWWKRVRNTPPVKRAKRKSRKAG